MEIVSATQYGIALTDSVHQSSNVLLVLTYSGISHLILRHMSGEKLLISSGFDIGNGTPRFLLGMSNHVQ